MARKIFARQAAFILLNGVLKEKRMLSVVSLPDQTAPEERARAERLSLGVLKNLPNLDSILAPFLRKKPSVEVLNILRLALYELTQKEARYGVVNEAVSLAQSYQSTRHFAAMINAVLRALPKKITLDDLAAPTLPSWIRKPLEKTYGKDAVIKIEASLHKQPQTDITVKGRAKKNMSAQIPEGNALPNGSIRLNTSRMISSLDGFESGNWWVQDAAASMVVALLAPKVGERILDICAAPGGKTMQIADAGSNVSALDISQSRINRLRQNLNRTKLNAKIIVADMLKWDPDSLLTEPKKFDAILLDAPCSATGTIRRHPDLLYVKDGSEIPALVALQSAMIERALTWLKPGGRLVFSTCSLIPQEGEKHIERLLANCSDLHIARPDMAWVSPEWITPSGGLRLRPDYWEPLGGMDGFFMARIEKSL